MKPDKVNILGVEYTIEYVDEPSKVDMFGRKSLWGQCDTWSHSIRIYDNGMPEQWVWRIIWHEVLHVIHDTAHLSILDAMDDEDAHNQVDLLAVILSDTLFRNGWLADFDGKSTVK